MKNVIIYVLILVLSAWGIPVKFEYVNKEAKEVYIAGDFNNWDTKKDALTKKNGGKWEITLELEPGKYEYKFVVDGSWTNDPNNPVKVGAYGNNAIEVGADGKVSFPAPGNLLGNPSVNITGDFQTYIIYHKNQDENWTMERPKLDFRPSIKVDLGRAGVVYTKFLFSTLEEDNNHNIFMRIKELSYHLSNSSIIFTGFYNKRLLRFDEPFTLIGYEGEFYDPFGWYETGVFVELKPISWIRMKTIFSNNTQSDRDLLATRLETKYLNITYSSERFFDKEYSRRAPFSGSSDTLYNTSHSQFHIATDFKLPFGVFAGILYSEDNIVASEMKVGSDDWQKTRKRWFIRNKNWLSGGIGGKLINPIKARLRLDFEIASYKDPYPHGFFFTSQQHKIRNSKISFQLEHSSRLDNSTISISRAIFEFGDTTYTKWDDLFYLDYYRNLTLSKYLILGYEENLLFEHSSELTLAKPLRLIWRNKISSDGIGGKTLFISSELQTGYKISSLELGADLECIIIRDRYLDFNARNMFKHFWLSYEFTNIGKISVGFGMNPYDFERDRRAWRKYLIDEGISHDVVKNNYMRLSRIIPNALLKLEKYRGIYLKGEVIF